ncbi:MAG: hypothetical protein LBG46_02815 [Elusimicrobiota bacterium]|jgi:hypothetical protein|nr:hypothetical protein [Elusimicrobiota bacterium]
MEKKIKPITEKGNVKLVYLQCVMMGNDELIHDGKSLGFYEPESYKYIFEEVK